MAIENIPQITASNSGGGIVYSIDFQRNFSNEPSKVTYRVVNSSGSYSLPTMESDASISFGGFNFSGYVYSYELEESVSGKTLSITLIDKSVILDKLYVCVFRRGLMGFSGSKKSKSVAVNFDADDEYYVIEKDSAGFFQVVKKNYKSGSVTRDVYGGKSKQGDIIIVGEEETPDTKCEIPASSYTFDELKAAVGNAVSGFSSCPISGGSVRQTYEGTLRSVLNSWCQDFGYSFYWDYSSNSLKFFDSKVAVFSIPTGVTDKKITSRKTFKSAEGKYNQVSVNYFAKPYNPKTASASLSKTFYSTSSLVCYNPSFFIDKSLTQTETSIYGGGRSWSEFVMSAALGYVSPSLRKIYNYSWMSIWGSQVGFRDIKSLAASKAALAMIDGGYEQDVNDLTAYSGDKVENLDTNYFALLVKYDQGAEETWSNLEQDIFTNKIGNFYRCPYNKNGETTFCTTKMIIKTSIDYEPEGSIMEDNDNLEDSKMVGRRIFSRGAPGPNTSSVKALEELKLADEKAQEGLKKLVPLEVPIASGSEMADAFIKQGVTDVSKYDVLMIFPNSGLVSTKIGFSVSLVGGSNEKETTYTDIENSENNQNSPEECKLQDPNEDKCLSGKEEIKRKQEKESRDALKVETKKPFSGLYSKSSCTGASIGANGGNVKILSSSQANYRCVITHSYSVEAMLDVSEKEDIISNTSGSTSSSSKIIETRLIVENRTTSENLSKDKSPTPSELATREGYSQTSDLSKATYVCAGFVSSLPVNINSGLESLDMSISDSGFSATYSYSTRPPVFAQQDTSRVNIGSHSSAPAYQLR